MDAGSSSEPLSMRTQQVLIKIPYRVADVMLDDAPVDFDAITIRGGGVDVPTSMDVFIEVPTKRRPRRSLRTVPLLLRVEPAYEWVLHDWQGLGGLALGEIRKDDPMHLRFIDVTDAESGFTVISSADVVSLEVSTESQAEYDAVVQAVCEAERWIASNS